MHFRRCRVINHERLHGNFAAGRKARQGSAPAQNRTANEFSRAGWNKCLGQGEPGRLLHIDADWAGEPGVNATRDLAKLAPFVGDIRLDERRELSAQLVPEDRGAEVRATSEKLLRAWAKWGEGCLGRVIGDFSFTLWNRQSTTLWCARDFVGARPFYYAQVGGAFCFSNTLEILTTLPEVLRELDEAFLGDFLLVGWNADSTRTVYRDIRRLPAGHVLKFSNGKIEVSRFRSLPIEDPLKLRHPEEYVEAYLSLLRSAVNDRLPQGETSLYLSGGLDFSSVCAVAAQIASGRARWQH
jgi:asparagine synthase (glutamine-hydrolysing)